MEVRIVEFVWGISSDSTSLPLTGENRVSIFTTYIVGEKIMFLFDVWGMALSFVWKVSTVVNKLHSWGRKMEYSKTIEMDPHLLLLQLKSSVSFSKRQYHFLQGCVSC